MLFQRLLRTSSGSVRLLEPALLSGNNSLNVRTTRRPGIVDQRAPWPSRDHLPQVLEAGVPRPGR
jgi:hypothetical protein